VTVDDTDPIERDTRMTGVYVSVLVLEAAIIVALWYIGRVFS
jgi:hypothetical protein